MMNKARLDVLILTLSITALSGCTLSPDWMPAAGPSRAKILNNHTNINSAAVQIVDINDTVTRKIIANEKQKSFSALFGNTKSNATIGTGDIIEISIWEAPPALLFGGSLATASLTPSASKANALPEQMVDQNGTINVPFVGQVLVAGRSVEQVQSIIAKRLHGIANDPQVLVRVIKNNTSNVTVIGDVSASTRMPLTPRGERLLDALASAGGVRQPIDKVTLQLTRNDEVAELPLQTIIRDPKQNIRLQSGDVVTALFQPLSFTVLGAVDKNQEINFEAQGISLAQAVARAGGLQDNRSDAHGVFIFRYESPNALLQSKSTLTTTPEGKVPVIYRIDLKDPASFFVAQDFPIHNKDVLYVSNASGAELQKFLNIVLGTVGSVLYPASTILSVTRR